jgi:hypothetical protein
MSTSGSARWSSREVARQLLEREADSDATQSGAATQRAFARLSENLRRSVGEDGYDALLVRAASSTESEPSVLNVIPRPDATGIDLDIVGAFEGHGPIAAGAAVESLIAALVDILSDLIGADMARNLLDHDGPPRTPGGEERR